MENGSPQRDWFAPIIADAEAGFGGVLNAFEITRNYIEAGASGAVSYTHLRAHETV